MDGDCLHAHAVTFSEKIVRFAETGRVAPLSRSYPNHDEGAHGTSLFGTGDGSSQSSRPITLSKSVQLVFGQTGCE